MGVGLGAGVAMMVGWLLGWGTAVVTNCCVSSNLVSVIAAVGELVVVAVTARAVGVVVRHRLRCSDKKKPTLPNSKKNTSINGANCCCQFSDTPKI